MPVLDNPERCFCRKMLKRYYNTSADVFPLIERIVSSLLPLSTPLSLSLSFSFFFGGGGAPRERPRLNPRSDRFILEQNCIKELLDYV